MTCAQPMRQCIYARKIRVCVCACVQRMSNKVDAQSASAKGVSVLQAHTFTINLKFTSPSMIDIMSTF